MGHLVMRVASGRAFGVNLLASSLLAWGLFTIWSGCTAQAHAQEAAPVAARAHALFEQAHVAFEQGRLPQARALLERSLALLPRPPTAINLARVQRSMGEFLGAEATLEALLGGRFGDIDGERRASTVRLRDEVRAAVGTIQVSVEGRPQATVTVDDIEEGVASAGVPFEVRVDPGSHVVAVTADDGARARQDISVTTGERHGVELTLLAFEPPTSGSSDGLVVGVSIGAAVVIASIVLAVVLVSDAQTIDAPVTDPVFPVAQALARF